MDAALWDRALRDVEPTDRRERRAITRTVVAVIALVGLAVALYLSGLTRPGLSYRGGSSGSSTFATQTARAELYFVNRGIFTERDVSVEIDYPGATITSARLEPEPLSAWSSGTLHIDLSVDCSAHPRRDTHGGSTGWEVDQTVEAPLVVHTERPWGTVSMESGLAGYNLLLIASTACETP